MKRGKTSSFRSAFDQYLAYRHDAKQLTPNVHPKFLQSSFTETVDAENESHRTRERCTSNNSVNSCVATDVQAKACCAEHSDEDVPTNLVLDKSSWRESKKPHGKTEASEHTAKSLRHFFEDQCQRPEKTTADNSCYNVCTLYRIRHRRTHQVYDQHLDTQRNQERGTEESLSGSVFDTNEAECQTRYYKNRTCNPKPRSELRLDG